MEHHHRKEYCSTRLKYRNSRNLTAVKVYTCADESRYLLVFGVPKINLIAEVKREFQRYGPIRCASIVTNEISTNPLGNVNIEQFTDVFRVEFEKLEHARRAKKFSDAKNFYGGILHISYATELESINDVRSKLQQRRKEVWYRLRKNAQLQTSITPTTKRKYDLNSGEYNKCLQCKRVFCCPQCRIKHEQKVHTNIISVGIGKNCFDNPRSINHHPCSLCTGQSFTLQKKHSHEMLKHLADQHLPLRCNKCLKVFTGPSDFLAITACKLEVKGSCNLRSHQSTPQISSESAKCISLPTMDDNKSIASTGTYVNDYQPESDTNLNQSNVSHATPVAQYNMRWNSKVGTGLLTDSISSIRNASSLLNNTSSANMHQSNQITQSPSGKSKLVRQTSTPMHRCFSADSGSAEINRQGLPNTKLSSFDSINSSEQMSSIYTPNHTNGSDCSPSESTSRASPSKPKTSRLRKKMPVAATPLRQVMSRSIQKAMVQHGLPSKFISSRIPYNPSAIWSPASTPLDLRTTPVIRRTVSFSSDSSDDSSILTSGKNPLPPKRHEYSTDPIQISTTENSSSTANAQQYQLVDSVYESCKSFDVNEAESQSNPMSTTAALPISSSDQTPKTSGVLIKASSFAERRAALRPSFYNEVDEEKEVCSTTENYHNNKEAADIPESTTSDEDTFEQWFTPCAKLRQSASSLGISTTRLPVAFKLTEEQDDASSTEDSTEAHSQLTFSMTPEMSDDENVFYENGKVASQLLDRPTSGGLWSLVTSVIRLASFGQEPPKAGISLLKRCASYAGRMTSFERNASDSVGKSTAELTTNADDVPTNKRRRTKTSGSQADQSPNTNLPNKISGRPPLKRMRRVPYESQ